MGIGDWGLGIGDWGLGIGPNPQSPIPNPQSPIPNPHIIHINNELLNKKLKKLFIYIYQKNYRKNYEFYFIKTYIFYLKEQQINYFF